MTKQEFKDFCHKEFVRRGFIKRKSMYYLKGKELLCGLYLQKSMADAFYVEYDFFIGNYEDIKKYPTKYEADIWRRIAILSKDTVDGERYMGALIEYERYIVEEIKPYFDDVFEKYIMPPIEDGKKILLDNQRHYFEALFPEQISCVLKKLQG